MTDPIYRNSTKAFEAGGTLSNKKYTMILRKKPISMKKDFFSKCLMTYVTFLLGYVIKVLR